MLSLILFHRAFKCNDIPYEVGFGISFLYVKEDHSSLLPGTVVAHLHLEPVGSVERKVCSDVRVIIHEPCSNPVGIIACSAVASAVDLYAPSVNTLFSGVVQDMPVYH